MINTFLSQLYLLRVSELENIGILMFFLAPVIAVVGLIIAIVGGVTQNKKIVYRGLWTILAGLLCSIGGFTLCSMNMHSMSFN